MIGKVQAGYKNSKDLVPVVVPHTKFIQNEECKIILNYPICNPIQDNFALFTGICINGSKTVVKYCQLPEVLKVYYTKNICLTLDEAVAISSDTKNQKGNLVARKKKANNSQLCSWFCNLC